MEMEVARTRDDDAARDASGRGGKKMKVKVSEGERMRMCDVWDVVSDVGGGLDGKKVGRGKKLNAAAAASKRKYWKCVNLEGEKFVVGDSVYVVNEKMVDFDDDEDCFCMVCGEVLNVD